VAADERLTIAPGTGPEMRPRLLVRGMLATEHARWKVRTIARAGDALDLPRSRPRTWSTLAAERAIGVAAAAFTAYLLCHLLSFEYGRDQGIYAVVGKGLLRGEVPYRDLWDFKPPGIFLVFALAHALFGPGMQAVRVLEALSFASLLWAFAIFSRRHVGSAVAGLVGGAFAVLAHVQLEFWNTAQPSSFAAVLVAWALVCATWEPGAAPRHASLRLAAAWLATGLLYACAALLKPPLGGGIAVSAAVIATRRRRQAPLARPAAAALRPLLFLAAGALLPVLLVLGWFAACGALGDMYEALLVFTPRYTALGLRGASFGWLLLRTVGEWFAGFSVANGVGLLLLAALPAVGARGREGALHVAGVIAIVLFGVALQAKFFPYHYGVALALTALLAGWGFWKLWMRLRSTPLGQVMVVAIAAVSIALTDRTTSGGEPFWARSNLRLVGWLNPELRAASNDHLYSLGEVDAATNRRVAAWLRARTPPEAPVFVWGFEPILYDLAERRPASRYIYNVPQRVGWDRLRARRRLLFDLHAQPPAAIVVEHGDGLQWVTGNTLDSAAALRGFPALRRFLESQYVPAGTVRNFDLYVRR
jgi:hypothetical protein